MKSPWNHNIHYHDLVLNAVPSPCRQALDIGCGEGFLTRQLAPRCGQITGIDLAPEVLPPQQANMHFMAADAMTHPFPPASFDLIAAVATLHHLPLDPALERFRHLLAPGGVLAIIGLYRPQALTDHLLAAAALPASWTMRRFHQFTLMQAPMQPPKETFSEIRQAAEAHLPGAEVKRRLLHRYSILWRKENHEPRKKFRGQRIHATP